MALLRDWNEYVLLKEYFSGKTNDVELFSVFAHQMFEFRQKGVKVKVLGHEITREQAYYFYKKAYEMASEIVSSAPLWGKYQVNLLRFFKVHYWEYFSEVFAIHSFFHSLQASKSPFRFFYVQNDFPYPESHTQLTNADHITDWALDSLAKRHPQNFISIFRERSLNRARKKLSKWSTSMKIHIKSLLSAFSRPRLLPTNQLDSALCNAVVSLGSGYDALIVLPDGKRIASETGQKWFLIGDKIDRKSSRTGLVWKKEYDDIPQLSWQRDILGSQVSALGFQEKEDLKICFSYLKHQLFRIEELDEYGLPETINGLYSDFVRGALCCKNTVNGLQKIKNCSIILTDFNGLHERVIEQLADQFMLKPFCRPHGWLNSFEAYEFKGYRYNCDGFLQKRLIEETLKYTNVQIIPDQNLLNVSQEWLSKKPLEKKIFIEKARESLGIDRQKSVLLFLTTAPRYGRTLNEFDENLFFPFWKEIGKFLGKNPSLLLLIKSHKRNFDDWLSSYFSSQQVDNFSILKGKLEDALILSDLVVDLGKPGTATLSTLLFERPLLLFSGLYKYVRDLGDLVYEGGNAFRIPHTQGLFDELEKFILCPQPYLVDLLEKNSVLKKMLVGQ
jgi:hypothetical protein